MTEIPLYKQGSCIENLVLYLRSALYVENVSVDMHMGNDRTDGWIERKRGRDKQKEREREDEC